MKRQLYSHLVDWKEGFKRKPLLIRGARQVGKTHLVRQLGETFEGFVEVNFEARLDVAALFDRDLDPRRLLRDLKALLGKEIHPGKTLLFFDEIQQAPKALTALRYFYEELPDLHLIAAGSLLDFAIEKTGIPVGRVTSLYLYPMSFFEFLEAREGLPLVERVQGHVFPEPMEEALHQRLLFFVAEYLAIGGMPEAVHAWTHLQDAKECAAVHSSLLDAYRQDFHKYAKKHQIKYVDRLFSLIPKQLGNKFRYSELEGDYRRRELAPCLDLLTTAGVVHRVTHSTGNGVPLGAEANWDRFKLLFLDCGLAQTALGIDLGEWLLHPEQAFVNRGELVEAFVGQELLAHANPQMRAELFYWHREARGSHAEVDYLLSVDSQVVPVEVKSGRGARLASLHTFCQERRAPYGIRLSPHNFSQFDGVHSYPLYAVGILKNI